MTTPNRPGDGAVTAHDPEVGARAESGDLIVVAGQGRISSYPFRGDMVIGRDAGCEIVVAHRSLSRRHARLRPGPPMTVQDLGSTNGTQIGSTLLRSGEPVTIKVGDSFHIGPFSFVVVVGPREDEEAPAAADLLRVRDPSPAGLPTVVRELARSDLAVLILGETGVGKEVLADSLHALSGRRGPLVRINCAAIAESLLESELFGHERGAFTGAVKEKVGLLEAAQGGTVFLDEIGELPLGTQAKLLRAVEQREILRLGSTRPVAIGVRFIAATNRDLQKEVAAKRFRRDLYYRLDGVTLGILPLRERTELIAPLTRLFVERACERAGRPVPALDTELLAALQAYAWPGNVRELKAVIERALLLARGEELSARHLVFAAREAAPPAPAPPPVEDIAEIESDDAPPELTPAEQEDRDRIIKALEEHAGNQTRAAKALGLGRTTLVTRLRLYRIPRPRS